MIERSNPYKRGDGFRHPYKRDGELPFAPSAGSEFICCAWGWHRHSWNVGPIKHDGTMRRMFDPVRVFWWYGLDLSLNTLEVADGEPESKFVIAENLPFRVLRASLDEISTLSIPNKGIS
jgi:hypothetical protein